MSPIGAEIQLKRRVVLLLIAPCGSADAGGWPCSRDERDYARTRVTVCQAQSEAPQGRLVSGPEVPWKPYESMVALAPLSYQYASWLEVRRQPLVCAA